MNMVFSSDTFLITNAVYYTFSNLWKYSDYYLTILDDISLCGYENINSFSSTYYGYINDIEYIPYRYKIIKSFNLYNDIYYNIEIDFNNRYYVINFYNIEYYNNNKYYIGLFF